MADTILTPEERDALAAELALGVLEGDDLAKALRLQLSDPSFAALVDDWRVRLAPMFDEVADVAPPDTLWSGISSRLPDRVTEVRPLDSDRSVVRQLQFWRTGALASGAVAGSLAFMLFTRVPQPAAPVPQVAEVQQPAVIAQLTGAEEGPLLAASYNPGRAQLRIRAVGIESGPLVPELWIIPADGTPRSLGFIQRDGTSTVTISVAHRTLLHDGAVLAVTMEKPSPQPHKAPGSAPVAVGKISTI